MIEGNEFGTPQVHPTAYVHPTAVVIGNVVLEAESSVWPLAVIRGDRDRIVVGARSNIQDGVILHCDPGAPCLIGEGVTVGHRAVVHGCTVEDGALIGIGAVILSNAVIGKGTIIGAGAVVNERKVIPPGSLAAGVPARVISQLTDEQKERLVYSAETYRKLKESYRR